MKQTCGYERERAFRVLYLAGKVRKLMICLIPLLFFLVFSVSILDAFSGNRQKSDEKIEEFRVRLGAILRPEAYNYSAAGKVDPFQTFLETTYDKQEKPVAVKANRKKFQPPKFCASKLECMDVGQLTLVAIIREDVGDTIVMAQDASGMGYILRSGMKLGYRNGRVRQIMLDRVVVVEDYEDINGGISTRKRILFLHPEEK